MDTSIVVIKAITELLYLEQLLIDLKDLKDIGLIAVHGISFISYSFGQCNELHKLTNRRNCQLSRYVMKA